MGKQKRPVAKEMRAQAVERLRAGVDVEEIADEFGVSRQRVGQWKKELDAAALKAAEAARGAARPNPDPAQPTGAGGGYNAAARAAGVDEEKPADDATGKGGEKKPDDAAPEADPIDGATVVEDLTDIVAVIFEAIAMFQDTELTPELERATAFSAAEKRRLLTYAQHWVPYWKKFGATGIGLYVGLGIFLAMSARKWRALSKEIERQDRDRRNEAMKQKVNPPNEANVKTAEFTIKKT